METKYPRLDFSPKDWNLIILIVDGRTLGNLMGEDGKPLFERFSHIQELVRHVGKKNVCIVFTSVPTKERENEIDAWLREYNFFRLTGLEFKQLAYFSSKNRPSDVKKACTHFHGDSYSHVLLIADVLNPLVFRRKSLLKITRILTKPAEKQNWILSFFKPKCEYLVLGWNEIGKQLDFLVQR
jgi:hypothetical protein